MDRELDGGRGGPASRTGRARRVDARRNLESILEAARTMLPVKPDASMQELASAAGVHRATVHRHFAARDDLVTALRLRAVDETVVTAERVASQAPGRAADVLEQVSIAVLQVADRYRLFRFTNWRDEVTEERGTAMTALLRRLIERGRRENEIRIDLEVEEIFLVWAGLIEALGPPVSSGSVPVGSAARLIRRSIASPT